MPSAPETTPILEMRGISKTFPGVKALANVELTVYPGEVHALMGENGAGKSTLMKILSGAYRADAGGELRINGEVIHIDGPLSAKTKGIAVIYQELSLSPNLTVAENIYLGRELSAGGQVDRARMRAECKGVLDRLGATFGPGTVVSTLSIAERQMVEIARAIHANARILVMDEPTTALSSRETDKLFDLIRTLRADGLAIIYISHRMAEVYELADRCSVLRDGSYVGTLTRDELSAEKLVKMMVGRDLSKFYKKDHDAQGSRGEVILSVRDMSDGHRVRGCSFDLHRGEVLCLAGLVGSGRSELARLIYGADSRKTGTVALDGKPVDINRPIQAVDAGIVYLTEDRKGQGLFLDMTVQENINLQVIGRDAGKGGILNLKKARVRAVDAIKALSIRVAGPIVEVGSLSGGNQQKVLLSRLLETRPRVLILDEPTRGVDIGAKSEIYRIIDDLVKAGVGVLVISSEMPEVVGIADRVLVMREGHIVGEVGGTTGVAITQENIIALAAGLAHPSAPAA
ncbi:D-xylose ABC transporter ATP-binding protein [Pleomorphomonas diazotrophica]|uniref:D-xylose ABC transporter ATP-binding protein n=1 Tax=Pleomorphomonas diazotrophica TaxID=1166257 RepID=A0A1I4TYD9_9HYPH|nr:sugar ABC transporter ATP-binding protein [Pleomorphomonas diazotrophica]PKR87769.1 D-xylose ABC transporter ATP-binding protein [Pleomorphomonas diazotrophica]SFM81637.1 monosaccharide ABC transporter ATP-binding protein, CUT2 family [Pleomorphomonas diazotrophica]